MAKLEKTLTLIMQVSIVLLAVVLFWFAFVYYPKTIQNIQTGKITFGSKIFESAKASSFVFPIETAGYKIEKSQDGESYYVFVSGEDLVQYEANRNNARLTLKTALSAEDTCGINVVYVSSSKLNVPEGLKSGDCGR
jgi:hypothetical protein